MKPKRWFWLLSLLCLLGLLPFSRPALAEAVGEVFTVAGGGSNDYVPPTSPDSGPATSAKLDDPNDSAIDSLGNLYITDAGNPSPAGIPPTGPGPRILKVDTAGVMTTIAGSGEEVQLPCCSTPGYGDGGPAIEARLNIPRGIETDSNNNLYFADRDRVRFINVGSASARGCGQTVSAGHIVTCAGSTNPGDWGDSPPVGPGPAVEANLRNPNSIAVDPEGNVFIADGRNFAIKRVDADTGIITRFLGNGRGQSGDGEHVSHATAKIGEPTDIDFDAAGNLYIATPEYFKVRWVDTSGIIRTFAGDFDKRTFEGDGGPATSAGFVFPYSVEVDGNGGVLIADRDDHRVRAVDSTGRISTIAGNGVKGYPADGIQATLASLNNPVGLEVDSTGTKLLIANKGDDTDYGRILRIVLAGPKPVVTGITPPLGPVTGDIPFTIEGEHLKDAAVTFAGGPAAITSNTETQIKGTVPEHLPPGEVPVAVSTGSGAADHVPIFTYHPALTALSPPSGRTEGGESLTIHGRGFTQINEVRITTNPETVIPFTSQLASDSEVTITTPAHPGGGQVRVIVKAYGLDSIAVPLEANIYTYRDSRPQEPGGGQNNEGIAQEGTTATRATPLLPGSGPGFGGGFSLSPVPGSAPSALSSPSSAAISNPAASSGQAQGFESNSVASSSFSPSASVASSSVPGGSGMQASQARLQLGIRPLVAPILESQPEAAPQHLMVGREQGIPIQGFVGLIGLVMLVGCFGIAPTIRRAKYSVEFQPQRA